MFRVILVRSLTTVRALRVYHSNTIVDVLLSSRLKRIYSLRGVASTGATLLQHLGAKLKHWLKVLLTMISLFNVDGGLLLESSGQVHSLLRRLRAGMIGHTSCSSRWLAVHVDINRCIFEA